MLVFWWIQLFMFWFDIRCYIILYYTIIIYYTYTIIHIHIHILYIILYLILYSSFSSSDLFSLFFRSILPFSFPPPFSSLPNLISSSSSHSSHPSFHSFYTCRYLHILIYILQDIFSLIPSPINNLTPHVLSEWMVEV